MKSYNYLSKLLVILFTISMLFPCFAISSHLNAETSSTDVITGKTYTLEDYTLLVYIVKVNKYDMSLHIDGSGNLRDKMLSIDLGTIMLMANYETVYTELHPIDFKRELTHTEPLQYFTPFNLQNNFTDNQYTNFTSEAVENVTAFVTFTVTQYYNFPTYNETHDFLTAQRFFNIHSVSQPAEPNNYPHSDLTWLLLLLLVLGFGSFYFLLSMSHRKTVVFDKKITIDDTSVNEFSVLNKNNLKEIHGFLASYEHNHEVLSFTELIEFQDKCKDYYKQTLAYKYLPQGKKHELLTLQQNQFINIPLQGFQSIHEITIAIEQLHTEITVLTMAIEGSTVFSHNNILIQDFISDLTDFIDDCRKYSKNIVFEKMENLHPLSLAEFESFEASFRHMQNKRYDYTIPFERLFPLIESIFQPTNIELLNSIRELKNKQLKIDKLTKTYTRRNEDVQKFVHSLLSLKKILVYLDKFDIQAIYRSLVNGDIIVKKE